DRSPPRIARPSRASPSTSARADEPTPAIAATPSAMQAMNTPNPRTPPRSSRNASLTDSPRGGAATVAELTPSPRAHRLRHEAAKQDMCRDEQNERHEDHQADDPDPGRHPVLCLGIAEPVDVIDVHRLEPGVGPRRRHEEERDEDQPPGHHGPGRQGAPIIAEPPHQIDQEERQPAVKQ